MSNFIAGLLFFFVAWFAGVITHANYGSIVRATNNLITLCEKPLPRTQKCILKAVPEPPKETKE